MQFIGLGNIFTKIINLLLFYIYKILMFIFVSSIKGLGKFIEISFEYLIKLIYRIYRFIRR